MGTEDESGLAGKVALISGGGAAGDGIGNGRAAAILLARAGVKVLVADRDLPLAERTAEMIRAECGTAVALASDVTREADCKALVDAAVDRWGRLDFLDNNVGIGSRGSVVHEKPEEYRRLMQVNVETMFLLSKYAIPAMIKTAKGGAIVNISSISALRPRGLTTYTTSKAAVIGLTQAMAVDHGRDNIRVNCICPGPMYTPMVYARGMSEPAAHPARQRLGAEDRRHRLGRRPGRQIPARPITPATSPARRWWWTAASRCKRRNGNRNGIDRNRPIKP